MPSDTSYPLGRPYQISWSGSSATNYAAGKTENLFDAELQFTMDKLIF
jgi:hypothetical protein